MAHPCSSIHRRELPARPASTARSASSGCAGSAAQRIDGARRSLDRASRARPWPPRRPRVAGEWPAEHGGDGGVVPPELVADEAVQPVQRLEERHDEAEVDPRWPLGSRADAGVEVRDERGVVEGGEVDRAEVVGSRRAIVVAVAAVPVVDPALGRARLTAAAPLAVRRRSSGTRRAARPEHERPVAACRRCRPTRTPAGRGRRSRPRRRRSSRPRMSSPISSKTLRMARRRQSRSPTTRTASAARGSGRCPSASCCPVG